jgi:hypothetical protein
MGFTVVMLPIALVLMMFTLTLISPKKDNSPEVKTYYDTVKVKQKVIVYDTVKVIKEIKESKKRKSDTTNVVKDTIK